MKKRHENEPPPRSADFSVRNIPSGNSEGIVGRGLMQVRFIGPKIVAEKIVKLLEPLGFMATGYKPERPPTNNPGNYRLYLAAKQPEGEGNREVKLDE